MFGLSELAILLIVLLIVFGAKKLPELARNAGKAARILKSEARAMKGQDAAGAPAAGPPAAHGTATPAPGPAAHDPGAPAAGPRVIRGETVTGPVPPPPGT
ncbi:twin-arginine translocase TatA/TatE family subunit [Streptomyces sp. NPDC005805]|uniref:twin-arginine translocase TatA/TatE family subunit n=1 Tax=Streptomyces sp. NPDC005805 TaxID=3157068 RepID=UPI0033EFF3F6